MRLTASDPDRARTWLVWVVGLMGICLIFSSLASQYRGQSLDFLAYYRAAERYLAGISPYQNERAYAFKYPAVAVLYFAPFTLFKFSVARWLYAILHSLLALLIPLQVAGILRRDSRLGPSVTRRAVLAGIAVSFLASFRFVDLELRLSQVGLPILFFILLGVRILQGREHPWVRLVLGTLSLAAGAVIKVHALLLFALFLQRGQARKLAVMGLVVATVLLIPHPHWWIEWARQIQQTTPYLMMDRGAIHFQGVYPLTVWFLGFPSHSLASLAVTLLFLSGALLLLPRFAVEEIRSKPAAFLLSLSVILLAGIFGSPLPWQYTYCVLWGFFLVSWLCAEPGERVILVALALFLGLSPTGVLGQGPARWLEMHQSVFLAILAFWGLLIYQARRVYQAAPGPWGEWKHTLALFRSH